MGARKSGRSRYRAGASGWAVYAYATDPYENEQYLRLVAPGFATEAAANAGATRLSKANVVTSYAVRPYAGAEIRFARRRRRE